MVNSTDSVPIIENFTVFGLSEAKIPYQDIKSI